MCDNIPVAKGHGTRNINVVSADHLQRFIHHENMWYYHIVGNFREVQIFAIFATQDQNAKIRTAKYESAKI